MDRRFRFLTSVLGGMLLASGMALAGDDGAGGGYCMDVDIVGFHMMPLPEGAECTVRDYWENELQEAFYPFTLEDHLFNCEVFGADTPVPSIGDVPSAVTSQGDVTGTIGGHPFSATLYCASLTNWYPEFCPDPTDEDAPCFQLAQPFLKMGLPFPRVTEVSVLDGVVIVKKNKKTVEVPLVLATRAAGVMHVEDLSAPMVGATITHSALGMVTYEDDGDKVRVLDGSLDLLLQGHIFFPGPVEQDVDSEGVNEAAVIKGTICSEALYKLLNKTGGGKGNK